VKRYNLTPSDGFFWRDGGQMAVPDSGNLRNEIIEAFHSPVTAGHFGRDRTGTAISKHYWWPNYTVQIDEWVRRCALCQANKPHNARAPGKLQPLPIPENSWDSVSVDFITNLPLTARGNDAIMVVVDRLTKMAHFIPLSGTATAQHVAQLFYDHVWTKHGISLNIVSDRDSKFTSQTWERLCELWPMSRSMSTAYHPQTDGQTERTNRTLEQMLRNYVAPDLSNWDQLLAPAEFAYNNARSASTGFTPFYLNYGRDPRIPAALIKRQRGDTGQCPGIENFVATMDELLAEAKRSLIAAQHRQKFYADPSNSQREPTFNVGDLVLLSTSNLRFRGTGVRKLMPKFIGPFKITHKHGPVACRLDLPPQLKIHPVFHISLIRKFYEGVRPKPPPWEWLADEAFQTLTERILKHREGTRGSKVVKEYLVRWVNSTDESAEWLPEPRIPHDLLTEYWERRSREMAPREPVLGSPLTSYLRTSRRLRGLPAEEDSTMDLANPSRTVVRERGPSPRRGGVLAVLGANLNSCLVHCPLSAHHPLLELPGPSDVQ
jgi:hypothetical protein